MDADSFTVLVGPNRKPFILSKSLLQFSEYFSALFSDRWISDDIKRKTKMKKRKNLNEEENIELEEENEDGSSMSDKEVVVELDCDEETFERALHVLHLKQFQTLPTTYLEDNELFALQNQLDYLGIEFDELDLANSGFNSDSFNTIGDPTFAVSFSLLNNHFQGERLCKDTYDNAQVYHRVNFPYGIMYHTGACSCENSFQDRTSKQAAFLWGMALKNFDSQEKVHYEKIKNLVDSNNFTFGTLSSISSLLITVSTPEIDCSHKETCSNKIKNGTKWVISFHSCLAWCIFCSKEPDYRNPNIMPKLLAKGVKVAKKQLESVLKFKKQQKS